MTMRFLLSQSPSQAKWQLQLKGLARRLLQKNKHGVGKDSGCERKCVAPPHSVDSECRASNAPGLTEVIWLS